MPNAPASSVAVAGGCSIIAEVRSIVQQLNRRIARNVSKKHGSEAGPSLHGSALADREAGGRMARALWKGSLSFGLVNLPVELRTAVRESRPSFRLLRGKDKSRVHFQRVAEKDGRTVEWDDIVKGYEYEKGRYIVL